MFTARLMPNSRALVDMILAEVSKLLSRANPYP